MKPSARCLAATLLSLTAASAQQKLSAADYARAEKMMGYNTTPLVVRSGVRPNWLGREMAGPAPDQCRRHHQLRQSGQPTGSRESEGPPAVSPRHHGQQRAALQYPAGGRRTDQGEQGFRFAAAAQPQSRFRQRGLHGAPPLGLFRALSAGRRTPRRIRAQTTGRRRARKRRAAAIKDGLAASAWRDRASRDLSLEMIT